MHHLFFSGPVVRTLAITAVPATWSILYYQLFLMGFLLWNQLYNSIRATCFMYSLIMALANLNDYTSTPIITHGQRPGWEPSGAITYLWVYAYPDTRGNTRAKVPTLHTLVHGFFFAESTVVSEDNSPGQAVTYIQGKVTQCMCNLMGSF